MDANEILKEFKAELDEDIKELAQIEILIKVARAAQEPVQELEQKQREVKASMARWSKALEANIKK